MAKRDPNKTARNRKIEELKRDLCSLQQKVFYEIKHIYPQYNTENKLNAFIGSKTGEYLNLHNDVIKTPLEYQSLWIKGFLKESKKKYPSARHKRMNDLLTGDYPYFKKYVYKFLERSFLKHYEELYKVRPKIDESEYWFGNNNDEFGLLVTPRYNQIWENDKSEIRHFKFPYWTISHVLETGLCYMGEDRVRNFNDVTSYLSFFRDIVRRTNSIYQLKIADKYIEFVESQNSKDDIPLMIPELRYDPFKRAHKYRLDYLIINPWDMSKIGFEFSPWSSHGKLHGKYKKLRELDNDAKTNYEREMDKHKKYWRKYGIIYITYTDNDLKDLNSIWLEMKKFLTLSPPDEQLEFDFLQQLYAKSDAE